MLLLDTLMQLSDTDMNPDETQTWLGSEYAMGN